MRKFCETYFPDIFYLGWSKDHFEVIERLETAIREGGLFALAMPRGTGKTTHINLWRRNLGDNVRMINGDKPIIQVAENAIVYGTPWAGKEGYNRNVSAPIKAICILKQGKTNNIVKLGIGDALNSIMKQVYMPKNPESLSKTLSLR